MNRLIKHSSPLSSYILSFFSTLGILYLNNRVHSTPIAVSLFFYIGFVCFYEKYNCPLKAGSTESKVLAFIFSFLLLLDSPCFENLHPTFKSIFLFLLTFSGLFFLFFTLIDFWVRRTKRIQFSIIASRNDHSVRKIRHISFTLLWIVYFLYFLNQYPGSLSCDTPNQLSQALGHTDFENANPFINTLILTVCVKIGQLLRNNVNTGIAIYTVVQFTFAASVFSYTVSTIFKHNFPKAVVILAQVFYNLIPYNIVYATGMWKDTFFSLLFLATLTNLFDLFMSAQIFPQIALQPRCRLFILVFLTSLARNSGWSSLLIVGLIMLLFSIRTDEKISRTLSLITLTGTFAALITISSIYPLFGITEKGNITTGISIPLQQIARVVAESGDYSEFEKEQINSLIEIEKIPELYDERISDPLKRVVNTNFLEQNITEYALLWIKLGLKNPKIYLDAYIQLTRYYWSLDSQTWIWDVRIFENNFGVTRNAKLFPRFDLTILLSKFYKIPKMHVTATSAFTLWIALSGLCVSHARKNAFGSILFVPIIMIFIGLMLTSPAALFRYTYGASVCIPLMLCFPFCDEIKSSKL